MGGKTAIALGLLAGLVAGGLIVGGVIALAPVPGTSPPSPTPAVEASSPPPASGAPSASAPASSVAPSASAAPAQPSESTVAEAFGIGAPAPALALPLVGGETIDLASLRGKPVWVNFMATWCAPCRDELPQMAGFAARYEDTGVVLLAVDIKEDEAAVQAFFQDLNLFFPVALDTDGKAQAEWGAVALPVHFWVDADGIVRDAALGGIGPDIMAQGLRTILPGVTVTP